MPAAGNNLNKNTLNTNNERFEKNCCKRGFKLVANSKQLRMSAIGNEGLRFEKKYKKGFNLVADLRQLNFRKTMFHGLGEIFRKYSNAWSLPVVHMRN